MALSSELWWISIILLFTVVFLRRSLSLSRGLPLPPGPRGGGISGIKKHMPSLEPWKTYAAWSCQYEDPIISFRVYNRTIVVLNSATAITELLERRSEIYSDRPMSWMYNVICDRGNAIFNVSSSDPRHKQYRKLLQTGLGIRATREYWPLIQEETGRLVAGLLNSPENLQTHVQRNAAAVIMKVAFGYTILDDDPFIKVAEEASRISGWATQPGRWLVDHHPIVRFIPSWFPGAGWKRQGLAWKVRLRYLSEIPHQWLKRKMHSGDYNESFASRLLRPEGGGTVSCEEEDTIKWCAGALYAGAGDTTVSAIISFILLMAVYPEVQRKAQDEIHQVFGESSFSAIESSQGQPEDDQQSDYQQISGHRSAAHIYRDPAEICRLPYLNAIMKEVLRFAPVGNLALPHRVTEEDEYHGYRIPKNATVMANVWAVMHDPTNYPDPFTFSPERFIHQIISEKTHSLQPDPKQWAFGFGRRACPGIHFAETTMLLGMFAILENCKISRPEGDPVPVLEYTTGITSHIKPFKVDIAPLRIHRG